MDYVLLKDVNIGSQNWRIKVRLVRFCERMSTFQPNQRVRIDLVLVDEEGNTMEGQVPEYWYKRWGITLKEDHVYKIRYFQVINPKTSFRAVSRECMIQFSVYTTVEEQIPAPANFAMYGHSAVSFDILRSRVDNDIVTSDTIVFLTGCSHARDQSTKKSGTKRLRNLLITDGIETINVALWGKHADEFDADACMKDDIKKPVILLLCAMSCRTFNDNLCLQNSALCRWYINPDVAEAHTLRESYGTSIPPPVWLDAPAPYAETENKTVRELALIGNPHLIEKKRFIITAKIKEIEDDHSWWYLACNKCGRRIREVGDMLKCSHYECTSDAGTARYRLPFRVVDPDVVLPDDEAPTIELVFFGPTAEEILGIPVHDLIDAGGGVGVHLPKKISDLSGKVLTVRASVGKFSFTSTTGTLSLVVSNIIQVASDASGPSTTQEEKREEQVVSQEQRTGSTQESTDKHCDNPEPNISAEQALAAVPNEPLAVDSQSQNVDVVSAQPTASTPPPTNKKLVRGKAQDKVDDNDARPTSSVRRKLNLDNAD